AVCSRMGATLPDRVSVARARPLRPLPLLGDAAPAILLGADGPKRPLPRPRRAARRPDRRARRADRRLALSLRPSRARLAGAWVRHVGGAVPAPGPRAGPLRL